MKWLQKTRYFVFVAAMATLAPAQVRPGTARPAPTQAKARDRNWLKDQLRRRYGTAAVPDKTDPKKTNPSGKKDSSGSSKS